MIFVVNNTCASLISEVAVYQTAAFYLQYRQSQVLFMSFFVLGRRHITAAPLTKRKKTIIVRFTIVVISHHIRFRMMRLERRLELGLSSGFIDLQISSLTSHIDPEASYTARARRISSWRCCRTDRRQLPLVVCKTREEIKLDFTWNSRQIFLSGTEVTLPHPPGAKDRLATAADIVQYQLRKCVH